MFPRPRLHIGAMPHWVISLPAGIGTGVVVDPLGPECSRSTNARRQNPHCRPALVGLGQDEYQRLRGTAGGVLRRGLARATRGRLASGSRPASVVRRSSIEGTTRWLLTRIGTSPLSTRTTDQVLGPAGVGECGGQNAGFGPWNVRSCTIGKPNAMTGRRPRYPDVVIDDCSVRNRLASTCSMWVVAPGSLQGRWLSGAPRCSGWKSRHEWRRSLAATESMWRSAPSRTGTLLVAGSTG